MRILRDGYVGIAPVPGGRVNVGIVLGRSWRRCSGARRGAAVATRIVAAIPATADDPATWRDGPPLDAVAGAWPLGHRVTRRAGRGWLLVGDAAGFLDPFTGEGLHRALVSAELAAGAILARTCAADDCAFAAYERAMQRRFLAKDGVSWLVQALPRPAGALRLRRPTGRRAAGRPCDDGSRDGRPRPGRPRARPALPCRASRAMTGDGRTRVGAYAICLDEADRILLCRLAPAVEPGEVWTLPGGGLDFGERPRWPSSGSWPRRAATPARSSRWSTCRIGSSRRPVDESGAETGFHAIRIVYRVRIVGGTCATRSAARPIRAPGSRSRQRPGCISAELARRALRLVPDAGARHASRLRRHAQHDRLDIAAPADLVFDLARDPCAGSGSSPTTRGRARSSAGRMARSSWTSSPAVRSRWSASLGSGCRWPGGPAPGASPRRAGCDSSTSPGRRGGWTSRGGSRRPSRGCRVAIDHDFRPRVALFAGFVDRAFTRPIAGRTLATFKALAEALGRPMTGSPRRERPA